MSTSKALDPHPALLVVRAVVTLENISGLLVEEKTFKTQSFRRMVESPPVHLGREASVSGGSAPVSE